MHALSWTFAVGLAGTLIAARSVPDSILPYLKTRASVTGDELPTLSLYAQYSAAAYCNSAADVGSTIECADDACATVTEAGAAIAAVVAGPVTGVAAFVATDPTNKRIVVAFRGSNSVRNWVTNLDFVQVPCTLSFGCLVHKGFSAAYSEMSKALLAALAATRTAFPSYDVVVTGHSLGGAVATVAAAELRRAGHDLDLYTFGSPRVGNLAFVRYVTGQAGAEYRVTHLDDLVARLPPMILNYRHVSAEYWLSTGTATNTEFEVADIKVCDGFSNLACNGGTLGLSWSAHNYYMTTTSSCAPDFSFKKRSLSNDSMPADRLAAYAINDMALADTLPDVWS